MALPGNLGTGTVTWTDIDVTGADVTGTGPTFTPSFDGPALDVGSTPPVTIQKVTVQSVLNASGQLKAEDGTSPLTLLANLDPDMNPSDWNWIVDFSGVPGWTGAKSFPFNVPQGGTVDLTTVTPVGASNGTLITQGPPGPTGPAVDTSGSTSGQVYTSTGPSSAPIWSTVTGGGGGSGTVQTVNGVGVTAGTSDVELTKANFSDLNAVDNTHDNAKNVATAVKWASPITLSLTGPVIGSANVDGSGNVSIATTLTAGGASGNTYVVSNQAGRLALSANVGDVARQIDNGIPYRLATAGASVDANWTPVVLPASTTTPGLSRLATITESEAGTDATIAVTPAGLKAYVDAAIAAATASLQAEIDALTAQTPIVVPWNGVSWGTYDTNPNRIRIFVSQTDPNATASTGENGNDLWFGGVSL